MPPQTVTIQTGSRLHFGPLSYHTSAGRHFGGVGMMVDRPGVQLTATSPPPRTRFGIASPRADALLQTLQSRHPSWNRQVQIDLAEEIPAHSGLGSGTQLALAITEAVLRLQNITPVGTDLAKLSGRGDRSAIGLIGYEQGGFLVDAGHAEGEAFGALAARVEIPGTWRILLIYPTDAVGLHGSLELKAFEHLGAMSEELSGRLCRLALTEMLPALVKGEFFSFSRALFEYGQRVGEFFASTQGGVFASPQMRELLNRFKHVEETGLAQSSWGPVVAMLAENDDHAGELRRRLWSLMPQSKCRIEITHPRNIARDLQVE